MNLPKPFCNDTGDHSQQHGQHPNHLLLILFFCELQIPIVGTQVKRTAFSVQSKFSFIGAKSKCGCEDMPVLASLFKDASRDKSDVVLSEKMFYILTQHR